MRRRLAALVLLVAASLTVAGCGGSESTGEERTAGSERATTQSSPSSGSTKDARAEQTDPLDGTWTLRQTKADVVKNLESSGFGKIAERFVRIDGVVAQDNWKWEFADGFFTAHWQQPDGAWKVADYGTYELDGHTVAMTFSETLATTTFDWSVSGDTLTLDWRAVDSDPMYKGIPDEAFWRAYLTRPLTRES